MSIPGYYIGFFPGLQVVWDNFPPDFPAGSFTLTGPPFVWYHAGEVSPVYFRRLRDLREDSDKTQQEIADYLIMRRTVYRRYESGEREIPVWAVVKLAQFYKTSTDYILGLTDYRGPVR